MDVVPHIHVIQLITFPSGTLTHPGEGKICQIIVFSKLAFAAGAQAVMFHNGARYCKAIRLTRRVVMGVTFVDTMAFFANEKLGEMTMRAVPVIMRLVVEMIMVAGNKGVQRFNAVDEAVAR